VRSLWFDYTFAQNTIEELSLHSKILFMLEKYERMERVSLLELALRKARICGPSPSPSVLALVPRKHEVVLEAELKLAKNLGVINGCAVIIPRVLDFM